MRFQRRTWFWRLAGWVWLLAGAAAIAFLLDLWSRLGGLVDERVRWWARAGLLAGPVVGSYAGLHARERAGWGSGRSHASLLRWFFVPPVAVTALACGWLASRGAHDQARAVFGTLIAYQAGFDAAIAAWPLACGRPYRFLGEIPPEQPLEPQDLARGARYRSFVDRVERDPP